MSSKLWNNLTENIFSGIDDDFIQSFRIPGAANKFVAWDPYEKSTRYLKFLLFVTAQNQSDDFFESYKKIQNTGLGNPISIRYAGCNINADYLASVEEWKFLERTAHLSGGVVKNIVEIGAGFGRTCHALLSLSPRLETYTIIDLEPMLALSASFLKQTIPEKFDHIQFVSSEDTELQVSLSPDLVMNIDSFQEMPLDIIEGYMNRVTDNSNMFYSKNPVGKYLPENVGMPSLSQEKLQDVFELGRCKHVLDVFDDLELKNSRLTYLDAYKPIGDGWELVDDMPMSLFPYFHHAFYAR